MENGERRSNSPEAAGYNVESKDAMRAPLARFVEDVIVVVDSSRLKPQTKNAIGEFLRQAIVEFEDDTLVERSWVTFESNGDIVRARSEEGEYDLGNSCRYLCDQLEGDFFNPLSTAFRGESYKEMKEVKTAVWSLLHEL